MTAYTVTRIVALPQSQKPQKARFNCDLQAVTVHPTLRHPRRASGPSPCQDNWRVPRKCSPSICVASIVALWVVVGNCVWSLCLRTKSWVTKASAIVGGTKSRGKSIVRNRRQIDPSRHKTLTSCLASLTIDSASAFANRYASIIKASAAALSSASRLAFCLARR